MYVCVIHIANTQCSPKSYVCEVGSRRLRAIFQNCVALGKALK